MRLNRVIAATCTVAAVALGTDCASAQSNPEPHTFMLRVDCRKDSDRGCTASNRVCANAPEGRYFAPQTVSGAVDSALSPGRDPICGVAETGGQGVPVNGLLAPTSMCAGLHAESGSGFGGLGQEYYVNCRYTATTYAIPQ